MSANVKQAIPFFWITHMESSLRFYVDGLGFMLKRKWIPEGDSHAGRATKIQWCWLELGDAAIMLQEFMPGRRPEGTLGAGMSVSFQCDDALALYREFKARGVDIRDRPSVGNGLWVVAVTDPDGYRMDFSSPTDAPEESELEGEGFRSFAMNALGRMMEPYPWPIPLPRQSGVGATAPHEDRIAGSKASHLLCERGPGHPPLVNLIQQVRSGLLGRVM